MRMYTEAKSRSALNGNKNITDTGESFLPSEFNLLVECYHTVELHIRLLPLAVTIV